MKKTLFVTTRNILTSSGELRLIKNRAETLYKEYGVVTDFIGLQRPERINADKKEIIEAGGAITCFPVTYAKPFQTIRSYKKAFNLLCELISSDDYSTIVFSGMGFEKWSKKIKSLFNIKIIFDIHGANEDVKEVAKNSPILKKTVLSLIYYKDNFLSTNKYKYSDGAFVVTEALEKYTKDKYVLPAHFKFYTVPCATSGLAFTSKEYNDNRSKYRAKYNIAKDEIVFIYSGGISSWQCIEETIKLYKQVSVSIRKKTRLLIFSVHIDSIKHLLEGTNAIHDCYSSQELSRALCAGDYAFLLRRNNKTNNVAFPNKFLEYVQGGMKIISTPYVYEIARQIKNNDVGILYDMESDISALLKYVESTTISYEPIIINEILEYNGFKERLQYFVADCV